MCGGISIHSFDCCVDGDRIDKSNLANTVTVRYWLVQQTMYVVMQHVLSAVVVV